jgi:hypothetical protein
MARVEPTPQQIAGRISAARALAANATRDEKIARLRDADWTLEAIGAEVGLSKQRVAVILDRLKTRAA